MAGLGFGGSLLHLLRLGSVSSLYIAQARRLEFLSAFVVLCGWEMQSDDIDVSAVCLCLTFITLQASPNYFLPFPTCSRTAVAITLSGTAAPGTYTHAYI